jgi:hypothetical protein
VTPASSSDVGREAAYAAEDRAFGGTDLDVVEPLDGLVAIAAALTDTDWWRSAAGPPVVLGPARAQSSSARRDGGAVVIRLADAQRTRATLAHELAHALAGVDHGHDATFRAAHIDVVAMLAGAAAATTLAAAYTDLGVPARRRRWPRPERVRGDGFVVLP